MNVYVFHVRELYMLCLSDRTLHLWINPVRPTQILAVYLRRNQDIIHCHV